MENTISNTHKMLTWVLFLSPNTAYEVPYVKTKMYASKTNLIRENLKRK